MYKLIEKSIDLGDGRSIVLETGKLAKQADGSVVVRMGKTMLLATVVAARDAKEDTDFMPLSVEYKEKYAATGRFPGGFLKREAEGPRAPATNTHGSGGLGRAQECCVCGWWGLSGVCFVANLIMPLVCLICTCGFKCLHTLTHTYTQTQTKLVQVCVYRRAESDQGNAHTLVIG